MTKNVSKLRAMTEPGMDHLSPEARQAAVELGLLLEKYKSIIEYDLMKYRLTSRALGIAHWDMDVLDGDNPVNLDNPFTWSSELRGLFGYSSKSDYRDIFANWFDLIHPEDKERTMAAFRESMIDSTGKTPFNIVHRVRANDGKYINIRAYGAATRDEQGKALRIAGAAENITAQLEADKNLRDAEDKVSAMLNATPLPVTIWDRDFRIIDCSKTCVEMFGCVSKEDLISRFMSLMPERQPCGKMSIDVMTEEFKKAFDEGYARKEWTHMTVNGEAILFDVIATRVRFNDDYAIILYPRDIREERKIQNDLVKREKILDIMNRAALTLLSRDEKSVTEAVTKGLNLISGIADIDRMSIFKIHDCSDSRRLEQIYRWQKEANGAVDTLRELKSISCSDISATYERILASGECVSGAVRDMEDREMFERFGCVTILAVPIFDGRSFWGITLFEKLVEENFSEQETDVLRTASFMLTNAIIRDKEAEALRQANDWIQLLFDTLPVSITIWSQDHRILDCSQHAVDLFGFTSKEDLSQRFMEYFPKYQPCGRLSTDMMTESDVKAFETGRNRLEWTVNSLSGEPVLLEATVIPLKFDGENVLMLFSRDIREEKKMLKELAERDEELVAQAHWHKSLLDGIPIPISVTDADMNLTFVNNAAEKAFGKSRDEIIGKPCSVFNRSICDSDECAISRSTRGLKRTHFTHAGVSYQADVEAIRDVSGGVAGYLQALQDVTEVQNIARRSAESANEAKSVFLAQMSHEMRTPLSAVLGLSELVLENGGLSHENEVYVDKIFNAGSTLLSIVNDILDISKIESGKFDVLPQDYDVPSLINDAITQNILRIHSKPVHFSLSIDENAPARLYGDDMRVKQIISNLLSNAFKYTDEGEVSMRVDFARDESDDGSVWVTLSISDTGVGIREIDLQRLFAEYTRFNAESNRKAGGTGLGLSITKRLVELMDGSVSVESEYGKGSVFTARIRQTLVNDVVIGQEMADHLMNLRYTTTRRRNGAQLERVKLPYARVLVVDDNMTNLDIAQGLMRPYGMEIDCATNGRAAIDAILDPSVKYDAVFMDHMMPGMDGVEAVRIIRNEIGSEYARNVPIIALTANAVAGNKERFLSKGFNAFVSKPIDIFRLDSVIRKWIWDKDKERLFNESAKASDRRKKTDRRRGSDRRVCERRGVEESRAKTIDGVDLEKGVRMFGDEKTFFTVLRSFATNTDSLLDKIANLEDVSPADYSLVVHGVKGSSRGVCADKLGEMAESLEFAAKAGDFTFVQSNHADFIRSARELIKNIKNAFGESDARRSASVKAAPDKAVLERLRVACENYDMDGIEESIREIELFSYTDDEGLAEWLRDNALRLNYSEIAERLAKIA